jgi:hypothetical protein
MLLDICTKCRTKIAISDGLCNICSDKPLKEQIESNKLLTNKVVTWK